MKGFDQCRQKLYKVVWAALIIAALILSGEREFSRGQICEIVAAPLEVFFCMDKEN